MKLLSVLSAKSAPSALRERERERERESKPPHQQSELFLLPKNCQIFKPLIPKHKTANFGVGVNHAPFSFHNLLKAYYSCRKRKRKTINAGKFELNFEKELLKLEQELKSKTYCPGRSICFIITDPKPREVFAADFRDRIIHHLLVGFLEPFWERKFIHHSYSCRAKKGAHLAIKDLKRFLRQASDNFSRPAYYLQVDVAGFFMSLDKKILLNIIAKHLKNPDLRWLAEKIIFHDPTKDFYYKGDKNFYRLIPSHKSLFKVSATQGLPIGNLTSQFFANVYLNELDQFAKHQLKIKYYLRYVDDLLIVHENPEQLKLWRKQISNFLNERLKLRLHPKKTVLQSIYKGINFVGFVVKPHHTLIRRKIVGNLKRKLYEFNHLPVPETDEIFNERLEKILAVINSYYGQFKHAQTFNLRRSLYRNHFGFLKSYIEPSDKNFYYFKVKFYGLTAVASSHPAMKAGYADPSRLSWTASGIKNYPPNGSAKPEL